MVKHILTFFCCTSVLFVLTAAFGAEGELSSTVSSASDNAIYDDCFFLADGRVSHPFPEDLLTRSEYILVDGKPKRLENGLDLSGKDLTGAVIHNCMLSNVDFTSANLANADLSQTCFENCSFRHAVLDGAILKDATFNGCDFEDASFNHTIFYYMTREQFMSSRHMKTRRLEDFSFDENYKMFDNKRRLKDIDFSDFDFVDVRMINAEGCCFDNAHFSHCEIWGMTKEQLEKTKNYQNREFRGGISLISSIDFLKNTQTECMSLNGLDLSCFEFGSFYARGYDFSGVDFTDASFEAGSWFEWSGLTKEQLVSTANWKEREFVFYVENFYGEDLKFDWTNVDFSKMRFAYDSLLSGDVTGANFTDSQSKGTRLRSSAEQYYPTRAKGPLYRFRGPVERAGFVSSKGLTREQIQSTWNWQNRLFPFNIERSNIDWSNIDFTDFLFYACCSLGNSSTAGSDFTGAKFIPRNSTIEVGEKKDIFRKMIRLLPKQLEATWNNKTGNMDVFELPADYLQQFDYNSKKRRYSWRVVLQTELLGEEIGPRTILFCKKSGLLGLGGTICLQAEIDVDEPGKYAYSLEWTPNLSVYDYRRNRPALPTIKKDVKYPLTSAHELPMFCVNAVANAPLDVSCNNDYVRLILWKKINKDGETRWCESSYDTVLFDVKEIAPNSN